MDKLKFIELLTNKKLKNKKHNLLTNKNLFNLF